MKTYTINIDRTGNLELSVSGMDMSDYSKIVQKFNQLGIKYKYAGIKPGITHFSSTFDNEDKISKILEEMGIKKHDPSMPMDIPLSSNTKDKAKIKVKSFSYGDLELELDKIDGLFTIIVRKIFKDEVSHDGKLSYLISNLNKKSLQWLIDALKASNYNTTSIQSILSMVPEYSGDARAISPTIVAQSTTEENPLWNIKISARSMSGSHGIFHNKLRQIINFLFSKGGRDLYTKNPEEHHVEISIGGNDIFYLRGSYKEFKNLQIVLEKNGFNTQRLNEAIEKQLKDGILKTERLDGTIDGFKDEKEFDYLIKKYEERFFYGSKTANHFFPEQIKGIKFLYSRNSALLGDEVGVGKSLQTIVAADMRMKTSGGYCLVITKDQVVDQLTEEIKKISGSSGGEISNDWSNVSKWTIIKYSTFSDPSQRKAATDFLINQAKSGKFAVCVLDEIHIIKNGEPADRHKGGYLEHGENHQTFNIQEITQYIPFVWGASSTIIANRPIDLLNQLKAINHPMGRMDYKEFLSHFDNRSDEQEQMRKADLIRDLLNDQGVYLRRSKKEVNPSLPDMNINKELINLTSHEVGKVMDGVSGKPSLAQLTKIRQRVALSKIEMSLDKAKDILEKGKKVAIFTAFPGSTLDPLVSRLQTILDVIYTDMSKKVAFISGGEKQDKKERRKVIEEFKNPSSSIMAIVISIDAGGTGLDFPNILTDVIVNDFDWSPSDDEQTLGRFHRISSKSPVNVTYMVAENTLDKKYFNLLQEKKEIAERIQNLTNQEKEAIKSGKSNISEEILKLRKQRYEEQMKSYSIDMALKT